MKENARQIPARIRSLILEVLSVVYFARKYVHIIKKDSGEKII